jgi:shikimate kinase
MMLPLSKPVRHVVLVGLMGSGKTTVGSRLATALEWPWHDSDAEIEAATGLTVRELRDRDGVDAMHGLEAAHLLHALVEPGQSVIGAAASVVDSESCRAALSAPDLAIIWLRASPDVLAGRFPAEPHRPMFGSSPRDFLEQQANRREPLIGELDPIVIDVDEIGPDEAVARVLDTLG